MEIIVGDGRGIYKKEMFKDNRKAIIDFFQKNPGSTQKECAEVLGISLVTVWKHLKEIRGNK